MPEFTMMLKDVIAQKPAEFATVDEYIGLDRYPIYDEAYRAPLNQKIIDHYQLQEIGQETIEIFRVFMRRKMNEIMPIYNQFYKSQLLDVDPFLTFDTTTDTTNNSISTATNDSEAVTTGRAVSSETPQNQLSENGDYATGITDNAGKSTNTGSAGSTDESIGSVNTRGFSGSMSDLLLHYRETFLNIDMQIIEELRGQFMLVWSNNDETFSSHSPYYLGWF